jgi:NADP-dependent 3-hydroxy acid dehydrogenase YdfG
MRPTTVLITGASSGIGRALALEYARGGAHLALVARRSAELDVVAAEVVKLGGSALPFVVDVTDEASIRDAVLRADRDVGALDMVIANAGCGGEKHASTLAWADVAPIMDVNVKGAFCTLLAAVPVMVAHKKGQLVGVSSLAGRRGLPTSAAYCATKAALSMFLESLRIDLAPSGIRVTDVQPGFVETPINAGLREKRSVPFLWTTDKAARHIVRRLERAPAVLAFPWPMAALTAFARLLPAWAYDRIVRAQAP